MHTCNTHMHTCNTYTHIHVHVDASEVIGGSSVLHNTLAIQNTVTNPALSQPVNLAADEVGLFALGSQQCEGFTNGGDPNTSIADSARYTSVFSVRSRGSGAEGA